MEGLDPNYGLTTTGNDVGDASMPASGTGAAFILQDEPNSILNTIEKNAIIARKKEADDADKLKKSYIDFYNNQPLAWAQDYPELNGKTNDLVKMVQQEQIAGRDINDPNNPNYNKIFQARQLHDQSTQLSRSQEAAYATYQKDIMSNPGKYPDDAMQKLEQWKKQGIKRGDLNIQAKDPYDFIKNKGLYVKGRLADKEATPLPVQQHNGLIYDMSDKSLTPEEQNNTAQEFRLDPKADAVIRNMYASPTITDEQRNTYTKEAKEASAKNGRPYTAEDMFVKHVIMPEIMVKNIQRKLIQPTKTTINVQNGNADGTNPNDKPIQDLWQNAYGLASGTLGFGKPVPNSINEEFIDENDVNSKKPSLSPASYSSAYQASILGTYDLDKGKGKGVEKIPNTINKGWKHQNGKLYVNDEKVLMDQKTSTRNKREWRPVTSLWADFIVPKVESNYSGAEKDKILGHMQNQARQLGINLNTMSLDDLKKLSDMSQGVSSTSQPSKSSNNKKDSNW